MNMSMSKSVRNIREGPIRNISDASDAAELPELEVMQTRTMHNLWDSSTSCVSSSPSDRTSLLQPE